MLVEANAAVQAVYSSDWGRIVATLIRSFGDFDVAEEAAQEAFAAAVDQWRDSGVPDSPPAWIIQTARHKAIDRIRELLDELYPKVRQFIEDAKTNGVGFLPPDDRRVRVVRRTPAGDRVERVAVSACAGRTTRSLPT